MTENHGVPSSILGGGTLDRFRVSFDGFKAEGGVAFPPVLLF